MPISPRQPPSPARAGSVRHSACLLPSVSIGWLSQPCRYSTCTSRIAPRSPRVDPRARLFDQRVAAIGEGEREMPAARRRPRRRSPRASPTLIAIGFSQNTWKPASSAAIAIGRVQVVRRDDRERVDPLVGGQRTFVARSAHRATDRRAADPARAASPVRVLRPASVLNAPGDQPPVAVERRRHAVDRADERAFAAADHAEPKRMPARSPRSSDSPSSVRIAAAIDAAGGEIVERVVGQRG